MTLVSNTTTKMTSTSSSPSSLSLAYHCKARPISTKVLGFSNQPQLLISLSLPLLPWLHPHSSCPSSPQRGYSHRLSHHLYPPPSYGSQAPQSPTGPDLSPSATPAQVKALQVAIGYPLYYGRSVDSRILQATCVHPRRSTA